MIILFFTRLTLLYTSTVRIGIKEDENSLVELFSILDNPDMFVLMFLLNGDMSSSH